MANLDELYGTSPGEETASDWVPPKSLAEVYRSFKPKEIYAHRKVPK